MAGLPAGLFSVNESQTEIRVRSKNLTCFYVIIVFEYFTFSVVKMEGVSIVLVYSIDSKICPFKSVIIMRFPLTVFLHSHNLS